MSVLTDVLQVARRGATTTRIASELGIDAGLAEAAVDHWVRLGVVTRAGDALNPSCHGCVPDPGEPAGSGPGRAAGSGRSIACAGCVFARR